MTSLFDERGKNVPCTVIQAGPCAVTQLKTEAVDGYRAVQLGFGDKRKKRVSKPLRGHFKKANCQSKYRLSEFSDRSGEFELGTVVTVAIFTPGEFVDVSGIAKGKGFQGVVKRHGFRGVGERTHGQHNRLRAPGSIGAGSDPSRVFKGTRMAGRTGRKRVKVTNLKLLHVDVEKNVLLVKGAVPGPKNGYLIIERWN